jgi:putative FmdB family regulatory protein
MATYDYKCTECDHKMGDVVQSIHSDPLMDCPSCGKPTLQRVINAAGGFRIGGNGVSAPTSYMKVSTNHGSRAK